MKILGDFTLLLGMNKSDTDGYLRNNYFESTNFTGRLSYKLSRNGHVSLGYKLGLMEKGIPVRNDPDFPLSQYDSDYPVVEKETTYYMTGGDNYWDKDILRYVSERTTADDEPMEEFVTASMSLQRKFFNNLTAKAYVSNGSGGVGKMFGPVVRKPDIKNDTRCAALFWSPLKRFIRTCTAADDHGRSGGIPGERKPEHDLF